MLNNEEFALISAYPCKSVQEEGIRVHDLPANAILLGSLKTLELQLQKRGMIESPEKRFNPIWFVAETERNVFLWRRGCSLIQKDDFEFWVDLPRLIEKRLSQLSSCQADNPFVNPLWGVSVLDKQSAEQEAAYLRSFGEVTGKVSRHLHALSQVGSMLHREHHPAQERVILPSTPKRP